MKLYEIKSQKPPKDFEDIRQQVKGGKLRFVNTSLTGADLSNLELQKFFMGDVNAANANFSNSDLTDSEFFDSKLHKANFSGKTNLLGAEFLACDLSNASFSGANLSYADFNKSNLFKVDFRGAYIDVNTVFPKAINLDTVIATPEDRQRWLENNVREPILVHDPKEISKLITGIKKHCGGYLAEIQKSKTLPYRGLQIKAGRKAYFLSVTPKDRKPMDSDPEEQQLFDEFLTQLNIRAQRHNSIFVTGSEYQANNYGDLYVIIPWDTAVFSWSKNTDDLILRKGALTHLIDPTKSPKDPKYYNLKNFQKSFKISDKNFATALRSYHEILISGKYYAVKEKLFSYLSSKLFS